MARDYAGRRGRYRDGRENDEAAEARKALEKSDPLYKKRDTENDDTDLDQDLDDRINEFRIWDEMTWENRETQQEDRDFYDGYQWTPEEVDELLARNQPVTTNNRIKAKINYILGVHSENKSQPRAYPRTPHHDLDGEAATDALRYIADTDDFVSKRASVASEVHIEGGPAGGVFEIEGDNPTLKHLPWDRIYYDPRSRKPDFSDARYMGHFVWMYRDEAEDELLGDMDPDSEEYQRISELLDSTYAGLGGESTEDRPRRYADGQDRVRYFTTYYKSRGEWHRCVWTHAGFIEPPTVVEDYYREEDKDGQPGKTWCPMWLTSAYRDRENDCYGDVRPMKSPQEEINKRRSKALDLLIHPERVIAETAAIPNPDEFMDQRARSGGVAEVQAGTLADNRIQITSNDSLVAAQLGMAQLAEQSLEQSGPHAAAVAGDQRLQSGRLYVARQAAAAMELKPVFDHLHKWELGCYERYWWMARRTWTGEKWLRVRDDDSQIGVRYVAINRRMTRGQRVAELIEAGHTPDDAVAHVMGPRGLRMLRELTQAVQAAKQQAGPPQPGMPPPQVPDPMAVLMQSPSAQEEYTDADVAQIGVDLKLDTVPDSVLVRHEQFLEVMELTRNSPILAQNPKWLRVVLKLADLRTDERRQLDAALTPDAPPPPDPAVVAMQQQQMQLAIAELTAKVGKIQSETAKNQAQAQATTQDAAVRAQLEAPAAAKLDIAQADLAAAKTQAVPYEAQLRQAQAEKTAMEAQPPTAVLIAP